MQTVIIYLLKIIGCSAVFVLYYKLFLRNKHFHYYNRFYLLFAFGLSIILPLVPLSLFSMHSHNAELTALMQLYSGQAVSNVIHTHTESRPVFDGNLLVACLLLLSVLAFLWPILHNIFSIRRLAQKYPHIKTAQFTLISTDLPQAPFSFFEDLFWRTDIDMESSVGQQILKHELTHIQQRHSWDKLFLQLGCAVFWINPFFWYIKKEMSMIHEFIADEHALEGRDASDFAAMLLQAQFGQTYLTGINPFALSPIKRRLQMIMHSKRPKYSYARRLMALPLLAAVTMLLAFRYQEQKEKKEITNLKQAIVLAQRVVLDTPTAQTKPTIAIGGKTIDTSGGKTLDWHRPAVQLDSIFKNALFIIDGKVATTEMRNALDPTTFKSFTVLKDKAVTDIYGDAGKNGVIIIETKSKTTNNNVAPIDTNTSGLKSKVWVRGNKSKTEDKENNPLIVLNGHIVPQNTLRTLNPSKIESFNIWKDESATKKYGEKNRYSIIGIKTKEVIAMKTDTIITTGGSIKNKK